MERYAPTMKDLASRDVISRSIYLEIREGRGIEGKDYVYLDATHLGAEVVEKKLPDITDFCRTYLGVDPVHQPMPIQPTAHYAMGGIPTDIDGRVVIDEQKTPIYGLYAAGECACVSVHGVNRLGTNSLVDLVVFGRRGGRHMAQFANEIDFQPIQSDVEDRSRSQVSRILSNQGGESAATIRAEMQKIMMDNVGVFREEPGIREAIKTVQALRERFSRVSIDDKGKRFNTDLLEAIELGNLLELAEVTAIAVLNRTESRGAHSREDYQQRDDENWLKHSLVTKGPQGYNIDYKPVRLNDEPRFAWRCGVLRASLPD